MLKHIGEMQRMIVEESSGKNHYRKSALYVDWSTISGRINSVKISNRDEEGREINHEITIEGTNGIISRALVALSQALEKIKSIEEAWESGTKQEMAKLEKETGSHVTYNPRLFSKEETPEFPLPEYGLKVRRSRYELEPIVFIVQGTEKEDTATEPPFRIEVEGEGGFVYISIVNIQPLVDELMEISQLPSL